MSVENMNFLVSPVRLSKKRALGAMSEGRSISENASRVIAFNLRSLKVRFAFSFHASNILLNGSMGRTVECLSGMLVPDLIRAEQSLEIIWCLVKSNLPR